MDRLDERIAHGTHQRGRDHLGSVMLLEKGCRSSTRLGHRLLQIQMHAVNPFEIQCDLLAQQFTDRLFYHA